MTRPDLIKLLRKVMRYGQIVEIQEDAGEGGTRIWHGIIEKLDGNSLKLYFDDKIYLDDIIAIRVLKRPSWRMVRKGK